ncbi:RDD family protein [Neobacillus sp. YIM B02564]|uniref:RDD family protein n=1 Tax=Neobacillus paridis TaxID=2803862 RepID=A0ABS1THB4_9BACI|nr:RDD family protein [Neobacillus paridis]MBL4950710.1 RDD family protein [Neobacillus paridis]
MNSEQMEVKTPEYVSLQFRLAGLGSRAAAFIIDQILLGIINVAIVILLIVVIQGMSSLPAFLENSTVPIAIAIIALFIINYGYFFVCEYFSGGRTLGKKLVGIRVIQDNGHSITLLSSFIRNLLRLIDSLPTGYFLGIIMVFFHSKHKRLGDLVAGTIVVHERKAKRKKKPSGIEKEIQERGLAKENLVIDEWTLKSFKAKDWKLINTYAARFMQLPKAERDQMTRKIADLLLPKIGVEVVGESEENLENTLLVLYLHLKDEWEFEL